MVLSKNLYILLKVFITVKEAMRPEDKREAHVNETIQKLDTPKMSDFICIFLGPSHQQKLRRYQCAQFLVHPLSKHLSFPDWEREGAKDFGEGGKRITPQIKSSDQWCEGSDVYGVIKAILGNP